MQTVRNALEKYGVQLALILVAAIWGYTFTVVSDAIALYPMYAFLSLRFLLAAIVFLILFPKTLKKFTKENIRFGCVAGILLGLGYIFQTWALDGEQATTAARCAFITGLYVVLVPFAQALIMKKRPRKSTIAGIATAVVGLFILSGVLSSSGTRWVAGDSLATVCAVAYTAHILLLGMRGRKFDPMPITFVQLLMIGIMCGIISLVKEQAPLPTDTQVIWAIVICAVFASALGIVIQNWAQQKVQPARVALILVSEPAFGGLFGWLSQGAAPGYELLGAALMLGGMLFSEVVAARRPEGTVELEEAIEGIPVFDEVESLSKQETLQVDHKDASR